MHDVQQVARLQQMDKSLKAGQFPVRWVEDLGFGYGYPVFNFYPHLFIIPVKLSIWQASGLRILSKPCGFWRYLAARFLCIFLGKEFLENGGVDCLYVLFVRAVSRR